MKKIVGMIKWWYCVIIMKLAIQFYMKIEIMPSWIYYVSSHLFYNIYICSHIWYIYNYFLVGLNCNPYIIQTEHLSPLYNPGFNNFRSVDFIDSNGNFSKFSDIKYKCAKIDKNSALIIIFKADSCQFYLLKWSVIYYKYFLCVFMTHCHSFLYSGTKEFPMA